MAIADPDLWKRIWDDPINLSSGSTLADLAMRQGLFSKNKALTLVDEYRRFLYLAATSEEVVAPSKLIDEIWGRHAHDRRAYVESFCPSVIGRLIELGPEQSSAHDSPAYERTLELYRQVFEREPHSKIWPKPDDVMRIRRTGLFAALSGACFLVSWALKVGDLAVLAFMAAWFALLLLFVQLPWRWGEDNAG